MLVVSFMAMPGSYAEETVDCHACGNGHPKKGFDDYPTDYTFGAPGDSDHPAGYDGWPGDTPQDAPPRPGAENRPNDCPPNGGPGGDGHDGTGAFGDVGGTGGNGGDGGPGG
jgi:hypothetical protein